MWTAFPLKVKDELRAMTKSWRELRQGGDDVFGNAVGEVFLFGIAAHVDEWQDRDRGLLARYCRGRGARRRLARGLLASKHHVIHVDRALDVLEGALAKVGEADRYLVLHLLARRSGNADSAGFRQRFEPSRDVHAVAVDVIAFDDDVADIDADAENDAAFFR